MDHLRTFVDATAHAYLAWALIFIVLTLFERLFAREENPIVTRFAALLFWLVWVPVTWVINLLLNKLWSAIGVGPLLTIDAVQALGWAGSFAVAGAAAVGILVADFFGYWYHRAQHAWLWRFHAVHHSIRDLNAVNSYHHVSEALFNTLIVSIPLNLISVDYGQTSLIVSTVMWFHIVFLHSPSKLHFGFMRVVIADNRYHRIHHSLEVSVR